MGIECSIPYNDVIFDVAAGNVKWCCWHDQADDMSGYKPRAYFDHPTLQGVRRSLEDGVKHPACRKCWDMEEKGITSWRMSNGSLPHLSTDKNFIERQVTRVEIKFDTTCDMACIYCGPWYSNSWERENTRTNFFGMRKRSEDAGDLQKIIDTLAEIGRYNHGITMDFTGGEPFLSSHFTEDNLTRLVDSYRMHNGGDARVTLKFATNANTPAKVLDKAHGLLRHIRASRENVHVHVAMSIESTGRYNEMSRYLSDWNTVDSNINRWLSQEWVQPMISSSFNALTLPDLANFVSYVSVVFASNGRVVDISPNVVRSPSGLSPSVLPRTFERYLDDALARIDSLGSMQGFDGLRAIAENMRSTLGTTMHDKPALRRITDYCINERGIDLREINPDLYAYVYDS